MAEPKTYWERLAARHTPSRDEVLNSRWLKPFGTRVRASDLWRFTRRSVPRGVLAGLFVGIFVMVPGLQIVGAAALCIPMRGNIPIAAGMTFLSNPATTPFFLLASLWVGNRMGFHADLAAFEALYTSGAGVGTWLAWLLSDAAPAMLSGLFVIALATALVGYGVSIVVWRWWVHRKWRKRVRRGIFPSDQNLGAL
jgi:uncharacterized protein